MLNISDLVGSEGVVDAGVDGRIEAGHVNSYADVIVKLDISEL